MLNFMRQHTAPSQFYGKSIHKSNKTDSCPSTARRFSQAETQIKKRCTRFRSLARLEIPCPVSSNSFHTVVSRFAQNKIK